MPIRSFFCARVFSGDRHLRQAYTVTGEKSYSYDEIAEHLSRGLGEEIRFVDPGTLQFIRYHRKQGRKLGMILVMLMLYRMVQKGNADITTDTTEEILKRKPRSLDLFIQDHRNILKGTQSDDRR